MLEPQRMADYFLLLDAAGFEGRVRPALAESWRRRSFVPCRELCQALLPAVSVYCERYHTGAVEPVLCRVATGLAFDRTIWRALVGEVLLFTAAQIPEFQVNADTLCCLLAPDHYRQNVVERERLAPIQEAHRGSRDLTFGSAIYRPEHAGYNNVADVARLADYLGSVRPENWTVADLAGLVANEEDRADELAFAREWFPALLELYQDARDNGQVVIIESIY
jgi:hypothetical protein